MDSVRKIQSDLAAGRFATAQKRVKSLAKRYPKNDHLQNLAGICFAEVGLHRPAIPYFQAAVRLAPDSMDWRCNLLTSLISIGELSVAQVMIGRLLTSSPDVARLHYLTAWVHQRMRDSKAAIEAANRALVCQPQYIDALNIRGIALSDLQKTEAALQDFQTILSINPKDVIAHQNSAERLAELGRYDEALIHYEAILRIFPHHAYALSRVASLCHKDGLDALILATRTALSKNPKGAGEKALLNLTIAVALDRQGQTKEAIDMYTSVHTLDAKDRPYDTKMVWLEFEKTEKYFAGPLSDISLTAVSPAPIFVVGLPRSGTTLVEMILSAASNVESCGEIVTAERLFMSQFASANSVDQAALEQFARSYREALPEMLATVIAFVDKMPANYRFIGLLLSAFPNAKVINVQRDPRDVALSLWKKRFNSVGMHFASRMTSIADQANVYRAYMNHWEQSFSEQILSIDYESLVQDVEAGSRRIAAHCGLEWEKAMLHPGKNTSPVRTASLNQVREKVHSKSVGQSHLLGHHLDVLISGLDSKLWPNLD